MIRVWKIPPTVIVFCITLQSFTTHEDPRIQEAALACIAQLEDPPDITTTIAVEPAKPQAIKNAAPGIQLSKTPKGSESKGGPPPPAENQSPLPQPQLGDKNSPQASDTATEAVTLSAVLEELKCCRSDTAALQAQLLRCLKATRSDVKQVQEELRSVKETCAQLLAVHGGSTRTMVRQNGYGLQAWLCSCDIAKESKAEILGLIRCMVYSFPFESNIQVGFETALQQWGKIISLYSHTWNP